MRTILVALTVLATTSSAFAQKIKVRKVKGNQAVVEVSSGAPLQLGQVYELISPDDFGESHTSGTSATSRQYVIGLNFSLYNTKSDASSANENSLTLTSKFGWNLGSFELGPLLSYVSTDSGGIARSEMKFGAFGDFNVIPNIPGEVFIYGVGGYASMGQYDGGSGNKSDIMELFGSGFVKWFPTGSTFAVRFDGGYIYKKNSGTASTATLTGLGLTAGLSAYF